MIRAALEPGKKSTTFDLWDPAMLPYEDIYIQLVDLPPISREHPVSWIGNTLAPADAALLIHKDIAESLRFARLWGQSGQFDGQQVGRDHPVRDGDVIEIHT